MILQEKNKKDSNKALIGTILFHLVLFISFMFFGLSTPLPLPEEEGVLIDLGFFDEGRGSRHLRSSPQPVSSPQPAQPQPAQEQTVTQSTEESIRIPDTEIPSPQERQEPDRQHDDIARHEREIRDELPREEPEPAPDPRALFPGREDRTTGDEGKGETGIHGDLGRPDGSIDGQGVQGGDDRGGVEFSLSGRRATHLPMPDYTSPETGRVVVSIRVNRQGEIVRASAGARGTTTSNQTLWRLAEEAARKAKFDIKRDAPEEQTGTITYNFIRLN